MQRSPGGIYRIIGVAIIVVGIIATIFYCRGEVKVSNEYLAKTIKYPSLYSLEDAKAEDLEYPVAKGVAISTLFVALGTFVYGIGDIIYEMDSIKENSEDEEE